MHTQRSGRRDGSNPHTRQTTGSSNGRLVTSTATPKRTKVGEERNTPTIQIYPPLLSGIQTSENAKFYARSAKFESFSNEGKTIVIQFTVKHEQKIDCGGGYVKVSEKFAV